MGRRRRRRRCLLETYTDANTVSCVRAIWCDCAPARRASRNFDEASGGAGPLLASSAGQHALPPPPQCVAAAATWAGAICSSRALCWLSGWRLAACRYSPAAAAAPPKTCARAARSQARSQMQQTHAQTDTHKTLAFLLLQHQKLGRSCVWMFNSTPRTHTYKRLSDLSRFVIILLYVYLVD